jgi:hypothetical protein
MYIFVHRRELYRLFDEELAQSYPESWLYVSASEELKASCETNRPMEMRPAPHSRFFEHVPSLSMRKGHSIGVPAAEAFMPARAVR